MSPRQLKRRTKGQLHFNMRQISTMVSIRVFLRQQLKLTGKPRKINGVQQSPHHIIAYPQKKFKTICVS